MAHGRRRVLGVSDADMVGVTAERLQTVRQAERAIRAAIGSEPHFLREPDDARLEQMLQVSTELGDTLEVDAGGWANRAAG